MTTFRALGACGVLVCMFLTHCGDDHFNKDAEMETIRKTLVIIPAWAELGRVGERDQTNLDRRYQEISKFDTQMIRETMLELVADLESRRAYTDGERSRLLILNRLVFKVPEYVSNTPGYRVWVGTPTNSSTGLQLLWPLEEKDGKLRMTPVIPPRYPQAYDAVAEFDYFEKHFPRRRLAEP